MKATFAALALCLMLAGCKPSTTTAPLAPGYQNAADQQMGESLAALNAFVNQEKVNYTALTTAQQATEKPYLNDLILTTNLANAAYQAYHAGTGTAAAAQTALTTAQNSQTKLVSTKETH